MIRAAILAKTDKFGAAFAVACGERIILVELDPWWTQISDRFGIVLSSANDDYWSVARRT